MRALGAFGDRLQPCAYNPAHQYLPGSGSGCPLCTLEEETGGELFAIGAIRTRGAGDPERDAENLWAAIAALRAPTGKPAIPSARDQRFVGRPYPTGEASGMARILQRLGMMRTAEEKERASRLAAARAAQGQYARLAAGWPALDPASSWNTQRALLAASREELHRTFAGRRRDIEQAGGRADLQRHLGSFALEGAGIRGIGRQRLQTLQAHGITTAADISATPLRSVPGIGPVLKTALEAWRASKQRTFRPGAGDRRPLPAADVRRIDARYADAIGKHLGVLRGGVDKLRRVAADGEVSLEQARVALLHAAQALAQAEADLGGPL